MSKCMERLYNGIVKENPTFVQMLGMCPTLAVTSSAINGFGMGIATTAVLVMSNLMISLLRKVIPDKVRIPAFITIIASFVTIVGFLMEAYTPALYESLGVFISLIVVNCIILGRAEAYASKNPVLPSIFDGIGMGLGFTLGLTVIGTIRELIGAGTIFGFEVTKNLFDPIAIFTASPGAFFVLAFIIAFINSRAIKKAKKNGEKAKLCSIADCAACGNVMCQGRVATVKAEAAEVADKATVKAEKPAEKLAEKPAEKLAEKPAEKPAEKTSDNAEKPAETTEVLMKPKKDSGKEAE